MSTELLLVWSGTVAVLAAYLGVVRAGNAVSRSVALATSLAFWGAFTMGSFQVTFVEGGSTTTLALSTYAYLGLAGASVSFVLLAKSVFDIFTETERDLPDETPTEGMR